MIHKATRSVNAGILQAIRIRFGSIRKVSWKECPPEVGTITEDGTVTIKGIFPEGVWSLYIMTDEGIYTLEIDSINPI